MAHLAVAGPAAVPASLHAVVVVAVSATLLWLAHIVVAIGIVPLQQERVDAMDMRVVWLELCCALDHTGYHTSNSPLQLPVNQDLAARNLKCIVAKAKVIPL